MDPPFGDVPPRAGTKSPSDTEFSKVRALSARSSSRCDTRLIPERLASVTPPRSAGRTRWPPRAGYLANVSVDGHRHDRAGDRAGPQPVADIDRQPEPPIRPGRQRQRGQRPAQPRDIDPASVHRVIRRPVPAAMLRLQRQGRQHRTGPSAHSTASASSNSASARPVRHRYNSPRKASSRPTARYLSAPASSHAILNATATASSSSSVEGTRK
jgi:hypothetical protein